MKPWAGVGRGLVAVVRGEAADDGVEVVVIGDCGQPLQQRRARIRRVVHDRRAGRRQAPNTELYRRQACAVEARSSLEEACRCGEHTRLDLRVGEIRADGLRVEIIGRAAELLVVVAAAGDVDCAEARGGGYVRIRE